VQGANGRERLRWQRDELLRRVQRDGVRPRADHEHVHDHHLAAVPAGQPVLPHYCGDGTIEAQCGKTCDGAQLSLSCAPPPGTNLQVGCQAPGSPQQCTCCLIGTCFIPSGGSSNCCGDARCIDQTGIGMVREGICIPFTCSPESDCSDGGYACSGEQSCACPGSFCAGIECCPGTGSTCVPFLGSSRCCNPSGLACAGTFAGECCHGSCDATTHTCSPSGAFLDAAAVEFVY